MDIALPGFDATALVYGLESSHSVFLAQAAHEHFLATCTSDPQELASQLTMTAYVTLCTSRYDLGQSLPSLDW